jgi:peptidoglycan/LPS O-acetylase OafA/YrhL
MVHLRRIGLAVAGVTLLVVLVAAFVTEGLGLAVIVAVAAMVVAAIVVPVLAVFEEERDLPGNRPPRRLP